MKNDFNNLNGFSGNSFTLRVHPKACDIIMEIRFHYMN